MINSVHRMRRHIPVQVLLAATALGMIGLFSVNAVASLMTALMIPLLVALLWRPGEPPVLLFAAGYQWLQVAAPIVNADLASLPMDQSAVPQLDLAAYLGLAAIAVLAVGMRVGRGSRPLDPAGRAFAEVGAFSARRLLLAYVVAYALSSTGELLIGAAPSLRQLLLATGILHWAVVFVILWSGFRDARLRSLALCLLVAEIAMGFLGFFSTFKYVMFVAIVAAMGATADRRRILHARAVVLITVGLLLAAGWQAIKADYRQYLNQGSASQSVLVSPVARMSFLVNRLTNVTRDGLVEGLRSGAERTGYLEYFARSIGFVPEQVPYQDGKLWMEAIVHILTPRVLFPEKAEINDSVRVNEFTGTLVAGAGSGTSISLGYVAESYVDFGPFLMFVPVFLLGVFWGWSYRFLAQTGPSRLLAFGFAASYILSGAILFEASNIKILGGAVTTLVVGWVLLRKLGRRMSSLMARRRARPALEAEGSVHVS
jgi:hypothetical protein